MIDPMLGVEANPALPNRQEDVVGRARFVPPKLRPHILQRPRVDALLSRVVDFPLTVVKAEAGYGKTTALASYLMNAPHARVWYNVGDREADPRTFLVHLIHALSAEHPGVGVRALSGFTSDHRSPRLCRRRFPPSSARVRGSRRRPRVAPVPGRASSAGAATRLRARR